MGLGKGSPSNFARVSALSEANVSTGRGRTSPPPPAEGAGARAASTKRFTVFARSSATITTKATLTAQK